MRLLPYVEMIVDFMGFSVFYYVGDALLRGLACGREERERQAYQQGVSKKSNTGVPFSLQLSGWADRTGISVSVTLSPFLCLM